jgi:hypothetical protein
MERGFHFHDPPSILAITTFPCLFDNVYALYHYPFFVPEDLEYSSPFALVLTGSDLDCILFF